ncbi:hypothetical protein SAMN05444362_104116 [Dysgonomonas macrotermitis]|uniref:Uncharacterized protein n=1 Tax=Dysgonomonas macrotermitis TaxID=1346286 RepID=A0A1M4ZKD3_9BACT|nr:hypothetical protein SAMN05444362_104116 [Dysgonomonas macrotermitis]
MYRIKSLLFCRRSNTTPDNHLPINQLLIAAGCSACTLLLYYLFKKQSFNIKATKGATALQTTIQTRLIMKKKNLLATGIFSLGVNCTLTGTNTRYLRNVLDYTLIDHSGNSDKKINTETNIGSTFFLFKDYYKRKSLSTSIKIFDNTLSKISTLID